VHRTVTTARAEAVSAARLEADVRRLARTPRHVLDDVEQARAAAESVAATFAGLGLAVEQVEVPDRGVVLPAVWACVPGMATDDAIVFSAHYDTVRGTPGADDNASGVAGVLELARVLRESPLPVSVVLAAVPFEEGDSVEPGGGFFAGAAALAARLCATSRVIGMVSLEMIGFTSDRPDELVDGVGDYLALVGDPAAAGLVETFAAAADGRCGARVVAATFDLGENADIARSDHVAFWAHSVPAAMATDTANFRNPHYHRPSDTPDTLDVAFMASAVRALLLGAEAYAAEHLGQLPG
jgi:Zn-dependent M28 family amino/carboxypeptidase